MNGASLTSAASCTVCGWLTPPIPMPSLVVVESERWIVRHHLPPAPIAGWLQLISRRHVQGPAHLDAIEAAEFGVALSMVSRALEAASGALRVYAIAFGEGSQHIHVHLVPRLPARDDTAAWKIADWYRAVERGEVPPADPAEVTALVDRVRTGLINATSPTALGWRAPVAVQG